MRSSGHSSQKVLSCLQCRYPFSFDDYEVIPELSNSELTCHFVSCPRCKASSIHGLTSGPKGVSSVGFLTDLTRNDLQYLISPKEITEDHIIKLYSHFNS